MSFFNHTKPDSGHSVKKIKQLSSRPTSTIP